MMFRPGQMVVATKEIKGPGFFFPRTLIVPGMVGVVLEGTHMFNLFSPVVVRFDHQGTIVRVRHDQIDHAKVPSLH